MSRFLIWFTRKICVSFSGKMLYNKINRFLRRVNAETMNKKVSLSLIIIIAVLLMAGGTYIYSGSAGKNDESHQSSDTETHPDILTAKEAEEDRNQAIGFIESVHPFFVDGSDVTPYESAKDKYIKATQHEMSWKDFQKATAEYFCFFQDGHTCIQWEEEDYLDISLSYRDGRMYTQEGKGTDRYITAVDGISTEEILAVIDKAIPAENEMARAIHYNNYFNAKNILELAGADMSKDIFTVKLDDRSEVECTYISEEDKKDFEAADSLSCVFTYLRFLWGDRRE